MNKRRCCFCGLAFLGFLTLTNLGFASTKLAYMVESSNGEKQIMVANGDADGNVGAPQQITQGKDWHLYPNLSGDGNLVIYVEGVDGEHLSVVVQNLVTGKREVWSKNTGMNIHPRLSKDGRFLAFSSPTGKDGKNQIYVVDLRKGTDQTPKVIPSDFPSYFPALSSDGSFLVFERSKAKNLRDLVQVDLDSGDVTPLTDPNGNAMAPAISFDDHQLTYTAQVNGNWDVYVMDLGTHQSKRLTQDPAQDFAPSFRPDGTVIFASNRANKEQFQLYEVKPVEYSGLDDPSRVKPLVQGADANFYAPSSSGDVSYVQKVLAPMDPPSRSSFGAVKLGSRVYVVGGHQGAEHTYPKESFTGRTEYYDLTTGKWGEGAPRSLAAHGFGLAAHGHYVYAFGGFAYSDEYKPHWHSLDEIERYDTTTNHWEVIGHLPHRRSSNVVAQLGTKVYLIGGWDSTPKTSGDAEGRFLDSIDVFDLTTEKVSTLGVTLPHPLRRALTGVVLGGEIVLIGGLGEGASHFILIDNVTAFNPATGAWRELPPLPFATFAPAAGVIDGTLYVFGGMYKTGDQNYSYVDHIYAMTPGASSEQKGWAHTGRYVSETKGFSQVVNLSPDTLGILGGHSYETGNAPVLTFESFQAPGPVFEALTDSQADEQTKHP